MKKMSLALLVAGLSLFGCATSLQTENMPGQSTGTRDKTAREITAQETDAMDMFPKAGKNETQHIIALPVLENEDEHKVEIFVTKTMEVDCNYHVLTGRLEEKELSGWGYNYYVFKTSGEIISTMMACPDKILTEKDVASESRLLNYNSRLPIVVYTPGGYKVKYKLWSTSSGETTAQPVTSAQGQQLTLIFDSHKQFNLQNSKATIIIFGFDASLADVAASVIAQKEVDVLSIPFSVKIDVPHNPESCIVPRVTSSSEVKYYLSFESRQKDNTGIQLDTQGRDIYQNLADLDNQTFYLDVY